MWARGETFPLHLGLVDPCDLPKCGRLGCAIYKCGGLRSRSPLVIKLKNRTFKSLSPQHLQCTCHSTSCVGPNKTFHIPTLCVVFISNQLLNKQHRNRLWQVYLHLSSFTLITSRKLLFQALLLHPNIIHKTPTAAHSEFGLLPACVSDVGETFMSAN